MDSVFDRLTREISKDERRNLLLRIGEIQDLNEEPLRLSEKSDSEPVLLEREFSELGFFARLRIVLMGFFSGRGRKALIEEHLMHRLQRKVERALPGMIDFQRELVSPKMYNTIAKLRSALNVFRRPLIRALEGDKPDFYALLGKLEFEDIQFRLEKETDPEKLSNENPEAIPVEIKRTMDKAFDNILDDIIPDKRRRMIAHTTALARLRTLVRFPYDRLLELFPPSDKGAGGPAPLRAIRDGLLELGDALWAFQTPPSTTLLEALFLFELQESVTDEDGRLESELTELMDRAAAALNIIRKVNTDIPWINLLKALASDIQYSPRPVGGGEDWFRVFKDFWKNRLGVRYRNWSDLKRVSEILRGLTALWGLDLIPLVSGYREQDFPDSIPPRHVGSLASAHTLFVEIFQGRLYHAMNLIMIDGKFYKKDNRREYEEVFGRFLRTPDKLRSFAAKLRPEGEYGVRRAELRREHSTGEDADIRMRDFVRNLDRECQNLTVPLIGDLKSLTRLLKGILDGSGGGNYDTLSNMAEIGGQGHDTFRLNLQDIKNIVEKSADLLGELVDVEEKRSLT